LEAVPTTVAETQRRRVAVSDVTLTVKDAPRIDR
jgi:hypothetical protein